MKVAFLLMTLSLLLMSATERKGVDECLQENRNSAHNANMKFFSYDSVFNEKDTQLFIENVKISLTFWSDFVSLRTSGQTKKKITEYFKKIKVFSMHFQFTFDDVYTIL